MTCSLELDAVLCVRDRCGGWVDGLGRVRFQPVRGHGVGQYESTVEVTCIKVVTPESHIIFDLVDGYSRYIVCG